jgi:Spy/CpxP family protein refolding chaperone
MKKQVLAVLGVVSLGAAAIAVAQAPEPRQMRQRPRAGMTAEVMKERLGLTEAQVSQLEKLRTDERRAAIQRRADTQLARLELEQLLKADTVDEKAVAARVKQLTDLHGAALNAKVDGRLALKKILTPEQQEKLRQMRAERPRGHRGVRPGRVQGGPGAAPGVDDEQSDGEDEVRPLAGPF